ncbi:MAG: histidine phosphatase family protein [Eubacterium sp.]|nr:histidine phosphatase family protein [Candidatus Colimonas fimequi]
MESKICLIRHGITEGNQLQVFYGGVDIPLAEEGMEQLRQQVEDDIYPRYENAEYYTSGMLRTEQTFEIIFGDQEHSVINNLREMNFGDYEMRHYRDLKDDEVFKVWYHDLTGQTVPPNGESISQFKTRVKEGFEELKVNHLQQVIRLRNQEKMAASVVVCHAGPICTILESVWPGKHKNMFSWAPDPGHGYVLTLKDGTVTGYEKF